MCGLAYKTNTTVTLESLPKTTIQKFGSPKTKPDNFLRATSHRPLVHPFSQPAVDQDRLPGDIPRSRRRQKHRRRRDFFRSGKAACGDVSLEPPPHVAAENLLDVRRRRVAGRDVVDRHAVPRDLAHERFGVARNRRAQGVGERQRRDGGSRTDRLVTLMIRPQPRRRISGSAPCTSRTADIRVSSKAPSQPDTPSSDGVPAGGPPLLCFEVP